MTTIEKDPNNLEPNEPGAKLDDGKILAGCLGDISLALKEVAKVFTFGANKYSRGGWQHVENGIQRYNDAAWRHKLEDGGSIAPDSGLLHLAHEAWNVLAELELLLRKPQTEKNLSLTPRDLEMRRFNAGYLIEAQVPKYEPKINEIFEVNEFEENPTSGCLQCEFRKDVSCFSAICAVQKFVILACRAVNRQDETNVIFVEVKPE
jgi:hypothetical protein